MTKIWRFSVLLILCLTATQAKADVIFNPYVQPGYPALSLEGMVSYEIPIGDFNTVDFWGGTGFVSALGQFYPPATGAEIAVEVRQYFNTGTFDKINFGLYAGLAMMNYPLKYNGHVVRHETIAGMVPGFKMTWKKQLGSMFAVEPYLSVSNPFYSDELHGLSGIFKNTSQHLTVTLGVRIGLNFVRK